MSTGWRRGRRTIRTSTAGAPRSSPNTGTSRPPCRSGPRPLTASTPHEFRILTQTAPPESGGTAGATTSVVTRSGSKQFHGGAYEFVRNDAFDARNFFSAEVEPLNQHQSGGTFGGPVRKDRVRCKPT